MIISIYPKYLGLRLQMIYFICNFFLLVINFNLKLFFFQLNDRDPKNLGPYCSTLNQLCELLASGQRPSTLAQGIISCLFACPVLVSESNHCQEPWYCIQNIQYCSETHKKYVADGIMSESRKQ